MNFCYISAEFFPIIFWNLRFLLESQFILTSNCTAEAKLIKFYTDPEYTSRLEKIPQKMNFTLKNFEMQMKYSDPGSAYVDGQEAIVWKKLDLKAGSQSFFVNTLLKNTTILTSF